MDAATKLRGAVARFFDVEEDRVGPSFSLAACQGSIRRAALDAAIRRGAGLKSQAVYTAKTFGELAADLGIGVDPGANPSPSPAPTPSPTSAPAPSAAGASCGVDLELVSELPVAADPWEDAFYRDNFSSSEIAYCLRQAEPAMHFAARWCAKEALRKCDRAFLGIDGKDVEVVHDESGAPRLVHRAGGLANRLPHAVSLSHTSHAAVAMVVRVDASPPVAAPALIEPTTAPSPLVEPVAGPSGRRGGSKLLVALNLMALALAALALWRTFPGLGWPFSR